MDEISITKKKGGRFFSFSNRDGKCWTVPRKNAKIALKVYEPSGVKGKLVKAVLPWFVPFSKVPFLHGFYGNIELGEKLKELLTRRFGEDYQFSIFWGTPCIDQKVTLQIYHKKKILGYCKLGNSERVKRLFYHENSVLMTLYKKGVTHVPISYGIEEVDNGYYAFLQSTEKNFHSIVQHRFSSHQEKFLHNMWNVTQTEIMFEDTDYYHSLQTLLLKIKYLDSKYRAVVEMAALNVITYYEGKCVNWGVCHGDFTAWNTCVTNDTLFVFDFEYALMNAPEGMDYWHFMIQAMVYENHKSMSKIENEIDKIKSAENSKALVEYLLYIISLYLLRGAENDLVIANERAELLLWVLS